MCCMQALLALQAQPCQRLPVTDVLRPVLKVVRLHCWEICQVLATNSVLRRLNICNSLISKRCRSCFSIC